MGSVRKELRRELRHHGVIDGWPGGWAWSWRYVTGAHLDGERNTDATWFRPGHYALQDYRVGRWSYLPRAARAIVRVMVPPLALSPALSAIQTKPTLGYNTAAALAEYEGLGLGLGGAILAYGGWKIADAALNHRHESDWVRPVHEGLAEVFGLPGGVRSRSYLHIAQGYQHIAGPVVRVQLPPGFLGEPGKAGLVEHVLRTRLDLYDPRFEWQHKGRKRYLTVWHAPREVVAQDDAVVPSDARLAPLYESLLGVVPGLPQHDEPRKWLAISGPIDAPNPNDAIKAGACVRLELPSRWAGEGRSEIKRAVEEKLDVDLSASWKASHSDGAQPFVMFKRVAEPPRKVVLADVREQLIKLKPGEVGLGLNASANLVKHNHDADNPHIFHSGESGCGKSTFLGIHISQAYRAGAEWIVVCDPKYNDSVPFLDEIDGITILSDVYAMVRGIEWVHDQMLKRFETPSKEWKASPLPPLYLVIDEINTFDGRLRNWWMGVKEKGDPNTPPILRTISEIAFQGRSRRVFMVGASQYFEPRIFGNAVLAMFGGRGFAKFKAKTWNSIMSVSRPRASSIPGRGVWATGDDWQHTQFIYGDDVEIREFALERTAPVTSAGPFGVARGPVAREEDTHSSGAGDPESAEYPGTVFAGTGDSRPHLRVVPTDWEDDEEEGEVQDEVLVSLSQAVDMKLISISKNTAKKYAKPSDAKYDPTFPKPAGKDGQTNLYRARELEAWEAQRPRNQTGEVG